MLDLNISPELILRLSKEFEGDAKKVSREIKIAINATAKKTKVLMSKQIRRELASTVKASVVKELIKIGAPATESYLSTKVVLRESKRLPLRDFGARQNKSGVSYKISKQKGRSVVSGAFQGPTPNIRNARWRNRVFKREGKARLPIQQLWGPSPWGVFVKQRYKPETVKETQDELRNQINRRINLRILRRQGTVK